MIEEFDGSFLIRAFLIERECVYCIVAYGLVLPNKSEMSLLKAKEIMKCNTKL